MPTQAANPSAQVTPQPHGPAPKSSMGNLGAVASLPPSNAGAAVQAEVKTDQARLVPIGAELNQQDLREHQLIDDYSRQMAGITDAMQRQRLVTIKKAQILKKVLPVVGLFSLIAGAADGMSGAIAALAGGLAGLSRGLDNQYDRAWKQYELQYNKMMNQAKLTQAELKSVWDDNTKTVAEKLDYSKVYVGTNKIYPKYLAGKEQDAQKFIQQMDLQDKRIAETEKLHNLAKKASARVTQDDVNFVTSQWAPWVPKPQPATSGLDMKAVTDWYNKYPVAQIDPDMVESLKRLANAGAAASPAAKAAQAILAKQTRPVSEAEQKAAWNQKHAFISMQIATIANVVGAAEGWDKPTAIRNTINFLRQNGLLKSGKINDAEVERKMESQTDWQ